MNTLVGGKSKVGHNFSKLIIYYIYTIPKKKFAKMAMHDTYHNTSLQPPKSYLAQPATSSKNTRKK